MSDFVTLNVNEFLDSDYDLDYVANYCYPTVCANFFSKARIDTLTEEEIKETIGIIHAFDSMKRFHHGGKDTLLELFIKDNGVDQIKTTITYLLFGTGKPTERMATCIYGEYKLRHFKESCVKETFGWVSEDMPLCNGRALKSIQWLGFGKMR